MILIRGVNTEKFSQAVWNYFNNDVVYFDENISKISYGFE